ncbi:MAG: hypothetical protein D6714_05930 [Bacteroidetes bacterium]|nr:MAG: hypothetical protein D6714_05930 [Bacteroidota bacterium]
MSRTNRFDKYLLRFKAKSPPSDPRSPDTGINFIRYIIFSEANERILNLVFISWHWVCLSFKKCPANRGIRFKLISEKRNAPRAFSNTKT